MKKNKTEKALFAVFAIVGIGLIIGGIIWLINGISFKAKAVEITGEIVNIESYYTGSGSKKKLHHNVYIDYEYNGVYYDNVMLGEYTSGMYEGKMITLLCDPDNPGDVRTGSSTVFVPIVLMIFGLVFGLVGIIPLLSGAKKNASQKRLLVEGRVLHAVVESVTLNTSYRVNGRSPYIIYCTYTDEFNGTVYRFKSNNIWNNPEMMFPVGSSINVHVDSNDYSKYYVDTEYSTSTNSRIVDFT